MFHFWAIALLLATLCAIGWAIRLRGRLKRLEIEHRSCTNLSQQLEQAERRCAEINEHATRIRPMILEILDDELAGAREAIATDLSNLESRSDQLDALVDECIVELAGLWEQHAGDLTTAVAAREHELASFVERLTQFTSTVDDLSKPSTKSSPMQDGALPKGTSARGQHASFRDTGELLQQITEFSKKATTVTEDGYRAMHSALEQVERTMQSSAVMKDRVLNLADSIDSVVTSLDAIQGIAGRTKLLALNASIIAAQAGEHGHAFSVVAHGIDELARKAGSLATDTSVRLEVVRDESSSAVHDAEETLGAAAAGYKNAALAGDVLVNIREVVLQTRKAVPRLARELGDQVELRDEQLDSARNDAQRRVELESIVDAQSHDAGIVGKNARSLLDELRGAADGMRTVLSQATRTDQCIEQTQLKLDILSKRLPGISARLKTDQENDKKRLAEIDQILANTVSRVRSAEGTHEPPNA